MQHRHQQSSLGEQGVYFLKVRPFVWRNFLPDEIGSKLQIYHSLPPSFSPSSSLYSLPSTQFLILGTLFSFCFLMCSLSTFPHIFIFILGHLSPKIIWNHLLHTLCTWFFSFLCLSHILSLLLWNQWRNPWHDLWFIAHSEHTLIRCRQGSLCCRLHLNDSGEPVALCFAASPPAFWTLQITSSSLIYGRHFGSWEGHEGEFRGWGV